MATPTPANTTSTPSPAAPDKQAQSDVIVQIDNVTKHYGNVYACDEINLSIHRGEFFSLLGASGCGKTTLLRILAGFETPSSGRILIDGVDMSNVPPYSRPVNMMFQSYALFPHMNVADNIAFGLKQENMAKAARAERVREVMSLVQIEKLGARKPHQLSGGQRQRVALARALAKHPKILLLDEPLGALDKKLREKTQFELVNIQERLGITFIVVTHDQEEAMTMSSRIALLHEGRVEQVDTPRRLYEFPATRYAADFIGMVNLFDGHVLSHEQDTAVIECADTQAPLVVHHSQPLAVGMEASVAIRPEKIRLLEAGDSALNRITCTVNDIAYLGDVSIYHGQLASGKTIKFTLPNIQALAEQPITWGQEVTLGWSPEACGVLTR